MSTMYLQTEHKQIENVANKTRVKTAINKWPKKINRATNVTKNINCLTAPDFMYFYV